jgi:hypothetical protein
MVANPPLTGCVLEAELTRRGYHYDPDRGIWVK